MNGNTAKTKKLVDELAQRLERSTDDVNTLIDGLSAVLKSTCGELGTIAIPGFGKFVGTKHLEHIEETTDGKRVIFPPQITVEFEPSTILKNNIAEGGAANGK